MIGANVMLAVLQISLSSLLLVNHLYSLKIKVIFLIKFIEALLTHYI
jgi:hypothetical protein